MPIDLGLVILYRAAILFALYCAFEPADEEREPDGDNPFPLRPPLLVSEAVADGNDGFPIGAATASSSSLPFFLLLKIFLRRPMIQIREIPVGKEEDIETRWKERTASEVESLEKCAIACCTPTSLFS